MIKFTVLGQPQGKGRPRFSKRGKHVVTYTPEKTVCYETLIAEAAKKAMLLENKEITQHEVNVKINAYFEIPKSWRRSSYEHARLNIIKPQTKPDIDNIAKAVLDGINGIIYHDDKQVYSLQIIKEYSEFPRIDVYIW
jgi:Holliday junction resolvase RusA-like endonuclease